MQDNNATAASYAVKINATEAVLLATSVHDGAEPDAVEVLINATEADTFSASACKCAAQIAVANKAAAFALAKSGCKLTRTVHGSPNSEANNNQK